MAKRIVGTVEVHILRNQMTNAIHGDSVFLDREKAKRRMYDLMDYEGRDLYLDTIVFPFIGKYVFFVDLYRGFDYGMSNMYDVTYKSPLYCSSEQARQDKGWKSVEKQLSEKPNEFNVYKDRICSKDIFGGDWFYGDVMEGKVAAEIRKLKVIR